MTAKNFRKRTFNDDDDDAQSEDEQDRRLALEEVKFLQRQRERKPGITVLPTPATTAGAGIGRGGNNAPRSHGDKGGAGGGEGDDKDDLVLQDTFAQETAVTVEDPNMVKYVEQELAKRRGKNIDAAEKEERDPMDELYVIPEHLKVKKRNSEESSTQWTTGIAEVQLPIEYKLKNIEETEAAKKLLQERRLSGKAKSDLAIPSSYSADYFQRGRDFAEKLRKEIPESYEDRRKQADGGGAKTTEGNTKDNMGQRQAATDEFMLDRFQKQTTREVLLIKGKVSEHALVQICEEGNSSVYKNDHIEVGCFLLRSKKEADEEANTIFVGKIEVGNWNGLLEEEIASFEADFMAEGVWNSYFGKYSRWY